MVAVAYRVSIVLAFVFILTIAAFAQDAQPGAVPSAEASTPDHLAQFQQDRFRRDSHHQEPGRFDFYVLALSWSPSFCESSRERNGGRSNQQQCGERPYAFVVHGLWPQFERGFPRECQVPAPRLNRNIVNSMLDLMPSPRLVFNQWDRHGTCSGLNGQQFFDTVRKARESVKIPDQFHDLSGYKMVTPDEVEQAFVDANPGLPRGGIAVTCNTRRLSEVRICMSKDLQFRDCSEIDRRSCRSEKIVMPPVRGG
jgi:ribonuclease T2